jgi:hypothetical protein
VDFVAGSEVGLLHREFIGLVSVVRSKVGLRRRQLAHWVGFRGQIESGFAAQTVQKE